MPRRRAEAAHLKPSQVILESFLLRGERGREGDA